MAWVVSVYEFVPNFGLLIIIIIIIIIFLVSLFTLHYMAFVQLNRNGMKW